MPISTYIRFLNLILGEAEISLYIDGQRYFSGMTYGAFFKLYIYAAGYI